MAACGSSNFQVGTDRLHVSWLHVSSVELLAEDGIAHMVGGTTSQQLGHVHQVPQFSTCSRVESSIQTRDLLVHFFTLTSRLNSAITCTRCATCGSSATVPLMDCTIPRAST